MRSVSGACCVVKQPRLIGSESLLSPHPGDRLVCLVAIEDVVGLSQVRLNGSSVLVESGMPLIGITPDKSIEILKAQTDRPQIEWSGLAGHPVRNIVHLAVP
jgi:hypothetical protein